MESMIRDDGWNKDNDAISELAIALDEAASMSYGINNCTVASTFDSAEGLLESVRELIETLTCAAEGIEDAISRGLGEPEEEEEDDDFDEM